MSTIISQNYKNFVAGVSQQPVFLRHPEQLEKQVNGLSTEAGGLQKRPPTVHVNMLAGFPQDDPYVHFVNRDEQERYIIAIDGTKATPIVCAYNAFTGERYTVNIANDIDYLKCNVNLTDLKIITIADYTFVVNRAKVVQMSGKKAPDWAGQGALFHVKSGQYGRTYRIRINNNDVATFVTPDGSKSEHVTMINTNYIVDQLAAGARGNGWTVWTGPSWLYVFKAGTRIDSVQAYDGYNNQAMFGILRTVQTFTQLPASAPNGFLCEVLGEKKTSTDDYYVRYDSGLGVWKETVRPGDDVAFNAATMPHVITRNGDGTFTFKRADWNEKETGDDNSNPEPSFVGHTINDIFFYRNRLGLLSDENIILSNSSDFFNFWMASATVVRDTDPIDLAVSDNKVAILYQAVPFGNDLVLFSSAAQFSLRAEGVLTPSNAKVDTMTYFDSDPRVKPVGVGRNIYFTARRNVYTTVKEYFTAFDDTDKRDAQDITSHVPSYIPNGVYKLVPSTIDNLMLVLTKGEPQSMFVYKFLFLDGVKQQSAWSKWAFSGTILGAEFIESSLYVTLIRDGQVFLEVIKVAYNTKDYSEEPYRVYLDRKTETKDVMYDDVHNISSISLSKLYHGSCKNDTYYVVTPKGEVITTGKRSEDGNTLSFSGDYHNYQYLFVGVPYNFEMELSTPMIKQVDNGVTTTTTDGRVQIQKMWFNYIDSGYFRATVRDDKNRIRRVQVHSMYMLDSDTHLDVVNLLSGTFNVPVQKQNTKFNLTIESDLPTPLAIIGGGYQARYTRRTRQV